MELASIPNNLNAFIPPLEIDHESPSTASIDYTVLDLLFKDEISSHDYSPMLGSAPAPLGHLRTQTDRVVRVYGSTSEGADMIDVGTIDCG